MMITGDHSSNDQIVNNVSSKFPDVEVYNILELVNTEKKIHTLKVDDDFQSISSGTKAIHYRVKITNPLLR